mmetsp:Transcript_93927/g.242690  ORF Transcript_93927/g.242690 Transcript_93927/m.242690 type:complete len:210 (+) Transcript_93927:1806-2435(+)
MAQQILPDECLYAPMVRFESLSVVPHPARGQPLVEQHVRLSALNLLSTYLADLEVVKLIPFLRLLLVLAVGDIVATAHGAYVLDEAYELILDGSRRRLVHEGSHVQRFLDRECHYPRVFGSIEPTRIVAEPLDVDAQHLWEVLEHDPLLAIILPLAMLAEVLVLAGQVLWRAVFAQAVRDLHSLVVEPALHLAREAAQHASPCWTPHLL